MGCGFQSEEQIQLRAVSVLSKRGSGLRVIDLTVEHMRSQFQSSRSEEVGCGSLSGATGSEDTVSVLSKRGSGLRVIRQVGAFSCEVSVLSKRGSGLRAYAIIVRLVSHVFQSSRSEEVGCGRRDGLEPR